ncbi:MAG: thiamine-phosphate kinase [Desulfovibrio sp.]|jgi:thiamine-monophosphate kinase|nr:thiamine-phosphate kinase [Desulfovibrio sp.]MBI4958394.1 thiamine-phosphate kinase [Desulfovibrio sp.]
MNSAPFTCEDQFLAAISARFSNQHPHMQLGRGDDCAVLACPESVALTTDLFVEDVHFRKSYFSPQDVGYKALAVNISDIAGMGAAPLGFSLGLAGPPDTPAAYWEAVLDSMADLANSLDIALVGGDLNACDKIILSVTIWGKPGPSGRFLQRGQAMAGDVLFVVGDLGLASVGLNVLEESGPQASQAWPEAVAAHLRPGVKVPEGLVLAGRARVRGLMDVSDGLARDLPRFLGNGLGANLEIDPDTLHPEVLTRAKQTGRDPAALAVAGGEDYALLGACAQAAFLEIFTCVAGVWAVGTVVDNAGVITLNGKALDATGFDHFA